MPAWEGPASELEKGTFSEHTSGMDISRLTQSTHRAPRPGLTLLKRFELSGARVHEFCGAARRRLALWAARDTHGPVLWIRPAWAPDRLHMAGVAAEIAPGRLIFADATRTEDLLWSLEEALRSGAVALAVAELPEPASLTPIRRLHLAAEAGADTGKRAPLGLLLTPGTGGSRGVESRWQLDPAHSPGHTAWHLARRRARTAPEAAWQVTWKNAGPHVAAPAPTPQLA